MKANSSEASCQREIHSIDQPLSCSVIYLLYFVCFRWVSEKTRQRINKVVDSFSPETLVVIITTLYFNARWKYPFHKGTK